MPSARVLRDQPYLAEHDASVQRTLDKGRPPRSLHGLITWAEREWALEVPDEIHGRGVWRDYGETSVGASALGSPRYSEVFRRYLEASDYLTDAGADHEDPDRVYVKPMHAALARIVGNSGPNSEWWYHASYLFQLACAYFDWRAVSARALIPYPVQKPYTAWALHLWWLRYETRP